MNSGLVGAGKCALCGGENLVFDGFPRISAAAGKFINQDYKVIKCSNCQFYFVLPPISFTQDQWQELYGHEYFGELTAWWAKKRAQNRQQRLDWLEKYCAIPIRNLLDIGCGEGNVLIDAAKRGWNASGIDIYDNRIEAAKDNSIAFTQGDLLETHFTDSHYDIIYLDSVLEHLFQPLDYLKEIRRILKTGGVVYISVPNEGYLVNGLKKLAFRASGRSDISSHIEPFRPPYHVIGFKAKSLAIAIEKSGFEIVKMKNFGGELEWRKFKPFSRSFMIYLALMPICTAAIPLKKRFYLEAFIKKK